MAPAAEGRAPAEFFQKRPTGVDSCDPIASGRYYLIRERRRLCGGAELRLANKFHRLSIPLPPSTALAVALVIVGSIGVDDIGVSIMSRPAGSLYSIAIVILSAILSLFVTFTAAQLALLWRLILWPINFCVLVGLSFAGNNMYQSLRVPTPPASHLASDQLIIPGHVP